MTPSRSLAPAPGRHAGARTLLALALLAALPQPQALARRTPPAQAQAVVPAGSRADAVVQGWFDANSHRPPLLRQFVQRMPKGADLHSHITGAVYAESYLGWAAEAGYCANTTLRTLVPPPCAPGGDIVPLNKLGSRELGAMVDRMSTRNLAQAGRSGHDQFFESFSFFGPATDTPDAPVRMLTELTERAASQHIQHLELMTTHQGRAVRSLGAALPWGDEPDLAKRRQWLLERGLPDLVAQARRDLDTLEAAYAQRQGCGTPQARPGCAVSVGWQQQTSRTAAPEVVFAQLTFAFELAAADGRVVGLNLVAPEDDAVALRDYRLHMAMIGFLGRQHPQVRIALHAGELALGLVPPQHMRHHIRDAVEIAGAHRIGHAVALGHEEDAHTLLARMRERGVAAEICLTSNDVILGVKGKAHPLLDYLAAGVPVVLASDDEGVSRIDLSNEYQRAVEEHGLSYRQLKQLSRNSLTYSFLPGPSLWQDAGKAQPVPACQRDVPGAETPSATCQRWLADSPKALRQWKLEAEFIRFEALPQWREGLGETATQRRTLRY